MLEPKHCVSAVELEAAAQMLSPEPGQRQHQIRSNPPITLQGKMIDGLMVGLNQRSLHDYSATQSAFRQQR